MVNLCTSLQVLSADGLTTTTDDAMAGKLRNSNSDSDSDDGSTVRLIRIISDQLLLDNCRMMERRAMVTADFG